MKTKKSKSSKIYDENGYWIEERGRIKGAIRRTFRLHPAMKEVLTEARVELPPKTLKDGSAGKKNQVRFKCAECGNLFGAKHVQVDHLETVVPLDRSEAEMPFDEWIALIARGIFCKKENLQVLCSTPNSLLPKGVMSCHRIKTNCENYIRDHFQKLKNGEMESLAGDLKNLTFYQKVDFFKSSYDQYLAHKEQERLAVEKRKLKRLLKKKTKLK